MLVKIIREVIKLCMFIILWGIPLLAAKFMCNDWYLTLLILSAFCTRQLFHHYEQLSYLDSNKLIVNSDEETKTETGE